MEQEQKHKAHFRLRAQSAQATQINRKRLFILISFMVISFTLITIVSLFSRKNSEKNEHKELFVPKEIKPDVLNELPSSYDQIKQVKKAQLINFSSPKHIREPSTNHKTTTPPDREEKKARESKLFYKVNNRHLKKNVGNSILSSKNILANNLTLSSDTEARVNWTQNTPGHYNGIPLMPGQDANLQLRKDAFLNQKQDSKTYNTHLLQKPLSPYTLMSGTVIAGSLISGLNSDLPGRVMAQVTEHVYDTVTGNHILIPQGSRLIGKYDSLIAFGQDRALVVWQRIILPKGNSIVIDNLPATDPSGYTGLKDQVDNHTWQLVKGVALATLLNVGTELTLGDDESDLIRAIRESAQENIDRTGQKIVEKHLNRQPTLKIRPGWPMRIIVNKDLIMAPYKLEE